MHSIVKIAGFAVAFVSLAQLAEPASASIDQSRITGQVRVEYKRSELMNEAGARQLFRRLGAAAAKACSKNPIDRHGPAFQKCRDEALGGAVNAIDAAQLTAVWSSPKPVQLARR